MASKDLFVVRRTVHGQGSVVFKWDPTCKYLATCGENLRVHIYSRNGEMLDELSLAGSKPCIAMEWNKDGEILAILQEDATTIPLYNVNARKRDDIEINLPLPCFIAWSKMGPQLAIGTAKGNLLIYNSRTSRKIPIMGAHSKKITCGAWNSSNQLALGSQDKSISLYDENGERIDGEEKLVYEPTHLRFASQKMDEQSSKVGENTLSVNIGKQNIHLLDTKNETKLELQFQIKYGDIETYHWYGDGYIMVGFSNGHVIGVSTHMKEITEELNSSKLHDEKLSDLVYSPALHKFASCGPDGVKVVNAADWREYQADAKRYTVEEGAPESLEWTKDGQILTVGTSGGYVFNYLMSIPVLAAASGTNMAFLSSLRNVQILDVASNISPISIEIAVEPSFLALGSRTVAVGMNNHAWFYNVERGDTRQISQRNYVGTVNEVLLNHDWCVVLCDGSALLHMINETSGDNSEIITFPEDHKSGGQVTDIGLTNDFLVYATSNGTLHHYYIQDRKQISEYRHHTGIRSVHPNPLGTRVIFIDDTKKGFLHSPVDDEKVEIEDFPTSIDKVLWDPLDANIFIAIDSRINNQIITFAYFPETKLGPQVLKVGQTPVQFGFSTKLLHKGIAHGQNAHGALAMVQLSSYSAILAKGRLDQAKSRQQLEQSLNLGYLKEAWDLAVTLKDRQLLELLARKALDTLDIKLAIRVLRELGETAMVLALEDLKHIEDKHLLAGHICLLEGNYVKAQALFLASSDPIAALQMRRDLLHWQQALKLATNLAPDEKPVICREYAQQLEVKGEYQDALSMYKQALESKSSPSDGKVNQRHKRLSRNGIARMTLRLRQLQRGRQMALDSGDPQLLKECAAILESMKQFNDAAEMYVQAECFEKAAGIYLIAKNFRKAGPLMDHITTPKLHAQYARAKEAERSYAEAAKAYERAKDMDSVVRLNLNFLDQPQIAFDIVRATHSADGAALVAQYCADHDDFQTAIEFLLVAGLPEKAFETAVDHKEMGTYAEALGRDGTTEQYLEIARYYDSVHDPGNAGKFYAICGDYHLAMKKYLKCGEEKIDDAIDLVAKAQGQPGADILLRTLHDFLTGEPDGVVKDPQYVFRLFMAIEEYEQAAETAIIIASSEQKMGNYATARQILFETHQDLSTRKIRVPPQLDRDLLTLHSYTLVRQFNKRKDHLSAARMLIRVTKNISKFPAHIVPILTSAVIYCHRSGLKRSAFEHASMLMRPEYKNQIDAKFKRKIESIVRRPPQDEEEEKVSPCPFCDFMLPETLLDCPSCKNTIPYCATTGRHMVKNDWAFCPHCNFAHLHHAFVDFVQAGLPCSMCHKAVTIQQVNPCPNPLEVLAEHDREIEANKKEDKEEKKENDIIP